LFALRRVLPYFLSSLLWICCRRSGFTCAILNPRYPAVLLGSLEQAERDIDFLRVADSPFTDNPVISFDRLVLEKTDNAVVFPLNAGWSDLYAWSSVYERAKPDKNGNVIVGDVMAQDCRNTFIKSDQMLIAAIGVKDMAVIATDDAILVTDIEKTEHVGETVDLIAQSGSSKHIRHSTAYRQWGSQKTILSASEFRVRELVIHPGKSLSLQKHMHRAEHWVVVEGTAEVICNDSEMLLRENESFYVAPGTLHRLANPGRIDLRIVEVQSGLYLDEDDVVRFGSADERRDVADSIDG